jgi:hypothetical protein
MKKETVIAIIFGLFLGGLLALFLSIKNKEMELAKSKVISSQNKILPSNQLSQLEFQPLEIGEPADRIIVDKPSINIKGKAMKNSLIIVQSPIKDQILTNEKDSFSLDFPLALGENVIKIVAYPKDNQFRSQEKEIKIYYIDSEL